MIAAVLLLVVQLCDAEGVRTFYERRNGAPAWDDAKIESLLRALDKLPEEGLDPDRYHRAALQSASGEERELLATDGFLAAARHISQGVADPQFSRPAWCAPPRRLDLAAVLQSALDDGTLEEILPRLAPRHEGYQRLRKALAVYRAATWDVVPEGRTLRPGVDDPRVADIRRRLGDSGTSSLFDEELEALVRHFQSHHGIVEDGIVGPETLREMNVSAADRAAQIAVNMERWRWLPEDLGRSFVVVNIAAFRLDVIEGDRSVLTMKTVVGKDYTRTPFFAAKITDVVANPWWHVPDSIASKELWPKQQADASYFARNQYVVRNGRILQRPGDWNALGRIKFNMPNGYNVYLHDTPSKSLFERTVRAFSHGCIRVEKPRELAVYLLGGEEALDRALEAGVEKFIRLPEPEPVYVLYWTAWVGDDGHMEFHRDHYGRDGGLRRALESEGTSR